MQTMKTYCCGKNDSLPFQTVKSGVSEGHSGFIQLQDTKKWLGQYVTTTLGNLEQQIKNMNEVAE